MLTPSSLPSADARPPDRWYNPVVTNGRAFPVLLSANSGLLNWIDTFGAARMRLVSGTWKQVGIHQGIDIYSERGSPVVSLSAGIVENVGWTFYSGYRVGVRGRDGNYYFYAHLLPQLANGIVKGASVSPGTHLGKLGNSGYGPEGTMDEFPPHLHFGLQTAKGWDNPEPMLIALYAKAIETIRGQDSQLRAIDRKVALLKGRTYYPQTTDAGTLSGTLAALLQKRATMVAAMIARG